MVNPRIRFSNWNDGEFEKIVGIFDNQTDRVADSCILFGSLKRENATSSVIRYSLA